MVRGSERYVWKIQEHGSRVHQVGKRAVTSSTHSGSPSGRWDHTSTACENVIVITVTVAARRNSGLQKAAAHDMEILKLDEIPEHCLLVGGGLRRRGAVQAMRRVAEGVVPVLDRKRAD